DDDPLHAAFVRDASVVRRHDALQDEATLPLAADELEVLPAQMVALAEVALDVAREDRRAALGVGILEVRHAVARERAQRRAEEPLITIGMFALAAARASTRSPR